MKNDSNDRTWLMDALMRLTPAQRVQLLEDCRAFARAICPGIVLDGDPAPQPLQPADAPAIVAAVERGLKRGAL